MKGAIELESCQLNLVPLMPDEDKTFSSSLVLDLSDVTCTHSIDRRGINASHNNQSRLAIKFPIPYEW